MIKKKIGKEGEKEIILDQLKKLGKYKKCSV